MVCVNRNMLEQLLLKWVIAPLPTANRQIYATPGEKPQYPLDKEGGGGGVEAPELRRFGKKGNLCHCWESVASTSASSLWSGV